MLAFLTLKMGVAIGKEIDTVIPHDDAGLAARVPWERVWPVGLMLRARTRWPTLNDGRTFGSSLEAIPRSSQRSDVARVSAGLAFVEPGAGCPL